jgi:hypothetical protein
LLLPASLLDEQGRDSRLQGCGKAAARAAESASIEVYA